MSVFMLETGAVQSAADSLNSVVSELESLSSSVAGYDTSQEGEEHFDFDGAKSVIAENIKAAAVKVQNTATVMNTVVESHTNLQNSMKYGEDASSKEESPTANKTGGNNSGSNSNGGGYYPSSSGGGSYSGGHSSGGSSGSGVYAIPSTKKDKKEKKKEKEKEEQEKVKVTGILAVPSDKYATDDSKKKLISTALAGVMLAPIAKTIGADALKAFEQSYDIRYTKEGFAQVGDRYVISCDESYGKVGDMIDIKQKDNSYIKCIIGSANKKADEYKNNVSFLTKEEVTNKDLVLSTDNIKKNATNVYNAGEDTQHKKSTAPTTQETTPTDTGTNTNTTSDPNANTTTTTNDPNANTNANQTNDANTNTTTPSDTNTNANNSTPTTQETTPTDTGTNTNTEQNTTVDPGTNPTESTPTETNQTPEFPEDEQVAV